jgi:two-component system sensor histidine kinase/response regulator
MEENRLSLESTPFTINSVIQDSLDIVSINAEKKNLILLTSIENNVPHSLIGDPNRLRTNKKLSTFFDMTGQIFVNLLSNSVKFSSSGDVIISAALVDTKTVDERDVCIVKFSVRDFGIGIPIDVQPRIFQPFFQADSSVNRRFGGSGRIFLENSFVKIKDWG